MKAKPKHALPESLRRDLAADRLEVAQLAIARDPDVALDLLAFKTASVMLGRDRVLDGPDVEFRRPRPGKERGPSAAARELTAIVKALTTGWLKANGEAARFEAFRSLPLKDRQRLLAYAVAMALKPKLGALTAEEATAYDAALSLTATSVAEYWRPAKDNFLNRCTRDQLLAIGSDVLGDLWSQSHATEKKAALVSQLDRLFSDPKRSGRAADQIEKLKSWLPKGMAFGIAAEAKLVKARKAGKAA